MKAKVKALSALKIVGLAVAFYALIYSVSYGIMMLPDQIIDPIIESTAGSILYEPILLGALTILTVFVSVKLICKTTFKQLGIAFTTNWWKHWCIGVAIGGITILIIWISIVLLGGYQIEVRPINSNIVMSLFCLVIAKLLVGYYEEALARGAMAYVGRKGGRVFSTAIVAMVFSLLHFFNPAFTVLSFVNTAIIAIIFAQLTWISGDLWIAIGYHCIWNTIEGFLGVPVSGIQFNSFFVSNSMDSSSLLSGGEYGLEASIPAFLILSIQVLVVGFLFIRKNRVNSNPTARWLHVSNEHN